MPRLLVIDESLSKRISTELSRRARSAKTVAELGLRGWRDPELLERLNEIDSNCVLVSGDDAMPATHAADLSRLRTTVAIVAPLDPSSSMTEPAWEHEIVQRWAHREEQAPGTIVRYSLTGGRRWTLRKRAQRIL
jgi:hypothetical protein